MPFYSFSLSTPILKILYKSFLLLAFTLGITLCIPTYIPTLKAAEFAGPMPCNASYEGVIIFNSAQTSLQYCNSSSWISMGQEGQTLGGSATESASIAFAVRFDGTNDFLNHGTLATIANSNDWSGSFWFRRQGGFGTFQVVFQSYAAASSAGFVSISFDANNRLRFIANKVSLASLMDNVSTLSITDTDWHHVSYSFTPPNSSLAYLFIDGQDALGSQTYFGNNDFDWALRDSYAIGSEFDGTDKFNGDLAAFWLDDAAIDFSSQANREDFRAANGLPAALGSDGSTPTGAAPALFLNGTASSWHTNKGAGDGLTLNGSLDDVGSHLIGRWTLDDTNTTALDSSVSANNGTMEGGLDGSSNSVLGMVGNGLDFDGSDDRITLSNMTTHANFSNGGTISLWFKPDFVSGADIHLISDNDTTTDPNTIFINSGGNLQGKIGGALTNFGLSSFDTTRWYHAAITTDAAGNTNTYIDGAPAGSAAGGTAAINDTWRIGRHGAANSNYFDGKIDDVRVYNAELSAGDISDLHSFGQGTSFAVAGSGTCSSPGGIAGEINYNQDLAMMQYCNGKSWVAMGPTALLSSQNDAPTNGLVRHYRLDDTNTTAQDSSSSGDNASMSGGLDGALHSAAGQEGNGLTFDGSDDRITGGISGLNFSQSYSISLWAFPSRYGNPSSSCGDLSASMISIKNTPDKNIQFLLTGDGSNQFKFLHRKDDDSASAQLTSSAELNKWTHLTLSYDDPSKTYTLFKDGNSVATSAQATDWIPSSPNTETRIGWGSDCTDSEFQGTLDDVRIYNRNLSAQDVQDLYLGTIQSELNANLAGHWNLDDTNTTALDISGNGSNGSMVGGLDGASDSIAGIINNALSFNGTSDTINLGSTNILDSIDSNFTLSAWIRLPSGTGGNDRNILKTFQAGLRFIDLHVVSGGTISFQLGDANAHVQSVNGTTRKVDDGDWHLISAVRNNDVQSLYVDGALVVSETDGILLADVSFSGSDWYIGSAQNAANFFNGDIDDARIYSRSLSTQEIKDLFLAGRPTTPAVPSVNAVTHLKLNEVSGASINDSIGLNNGTWSDGANNDVAEETVSGKIATAIDFDGSDDIITIADDNSINFDRTDDYSIGFWIKIPTANQPSALNDVSILEKWAAPHTDPYPFAFRFTTHNHGTTPFRIGMDRFNGTTTASVISTSLLNDNEWHHVIGTKTDADNKLRLYIDGALQDEQDDVTTGTTQNSDSLVIGERPGLADTQIQASIDDIRIYNAALTAQQINDLYINGSLGLAEDGSDQGSGCTAPTGTAGELVYNDDHNIMQFCNGFVWVSTNRE